MIKDPNLEQPTVHPSWYQRCVTITPVLTWVRVCYNHHQHRANLSKRKHQAQTENTEQSLRSSCLTEVGHPTILQGTERPE